MTKNTPKHILLKQEVQQDIQDNKKMGVVRLKGSSVVVRPCRKAQRLLDRGYRQWLISRGIIRPKADVEFDGIH